MTRLTRYEARMDVFRRELSWMGKYVNGCDCSREQTLVTGIASTNRQVLVFSENVYELLGWRDGELKGQSFLEFTDKRWWPSTLSTIQTAMKWGVAEHSKYYRRKDGRLIPVHLTVRSTFERGEPGTIAFIRQICPHLEQAMGLRPLQVFPYLVST